MKKIASKLGIAVTAFVLSLAGIWMFNVGYEVVRTLQKGVPENPDLIKNVNSIKEEIELEDITISRGCGPDGYSQSYVRTNGELILIEGALKMSPKKFYASLKGEQIIEKLKSAKNRYGEKGVRIITKENGKEANFNIYWYKKGNMKYISAPTLERAIEFERFGSSAIY